ncbi:serine protease [Candidatus Saccharibacteria bacterium]|nr:serine protease [Candidatus Saccharibacteria bacterium]
MQKTKNSKNGKSKGRAKAKKGFFASKINSNKSSVAKKRIKKAKIIKYSPKSSKKSLAKKKNYGPVGRVIHHPATKISLGAILAIGAFFLIRENIVPSLESVQESVIQIEACNDLDYECGSGSGFAMFKDNYIVTNYHVIAGADSIKIKTSADVEGKATNIIAFDPIKDIAIIEWDHTLTPIRIGSSENAKVGDKVLAIGNPLSESNVVSEGIISSKTSEHGIMTTAAISPGSSGGALILDSDHRVIGVTYLKQSGGESMNYAIKIEDVVSVHDNYKDNKAFAINQNNSEGCYPTLANIALDADNLNFTGCKDSPTDIYTTSSINIFKDITNNRVRFEHALVERSDWKVLYDRLDSVVKNALVATLDDSTSALFDTNWKFAIWVANEAFYYSCQTDSCMFRRYIYGTYPTGYQVNTTAEELQQLKASKKLKE